MKLNAGCGKNTWGDIRIDIDPKVKGLTHVMDICKMTFHDKYFDETRCISVLEHIRDWRKAIKELCRVTKGSLLIEVPVNSNILITDIFRILIPSPRNIMLFLTRKKRNEETFHQFDPEIIKKEIEDQGFKVKYGKIFQIYESYPSRCWRLECFRN